MAAQVASGHAGEHARGFFAPTVEVLLKQRAEWRESLGGKSLLRSEDLSSQSSEWEGDDKDEPEEEEKKEEEKKPEAAAAAPSALKSGDFGASKMLNPIDETPINFAETQKFFAAQHYEADTEEAGDFPSLTIHYSSHAGGGAASGRASSRFTRRTNEPVGRRMARIRGEAEAFLSWADGHKKVQAQAASSGESVVLQEASMLREEMTAISGLFHRAQEVHSIGPEAACKRVWLPPSETDSLHMVQHLIDYNRFAQGHGHDSAPGSHSHGDHNRPVSYKFSAKMGKEGGWLAAVENEVLAELEQRVKSIGAVLGKGSGSAGSAAAGGGAAGSASEGGSLANTMAQLHRRLQTLQHVQDAPSCERLRATARLLSSDIDMAISEARHLEAVEADAGPDLYEEDTLAQQVARLHENLAPLDAVALRVGDIGRQLATQEGTYEELANFSRDLAGAEAQTRHASELLQAAAAAAMEMKSSAEANRIQLQANVKTLEKKLAEWQDRVAKAEVAKAEAAAAALAEEKPEAEGDGKAKKADEKKVATKT
mmetsp:Transcript_107652/g.343601  ORF Transcript_107652/g.343601 Transcript_107652/m.343601 type:complete len:541 (+) Transcript_107652:63-1685(+)